MRGIAVVAITVGLVLAACGGKSDTPSDRAAEAAEDAANAAAASSTDAAAVSPQAAPTGPGQSNKVSSDNPEDDRIWYGVAMGMNPPICISLDYTARIFRIHESLNSPDDSIKVLEMAGARLTVLKKEEGRVFIRLSSYDQQNIMAFIRGKNSCEFSIMLVLAQTNEHPDLTLGEVAKATDYFSAQVPYIAAEAAATAAASLTPGSSPQTRRSDASYPKGEGAGARAAGDGNIDDLLPTRPSRAKESLSAEPKSRMAAIAAAQAKPPPHKIDPAPGDLEDILKAESAPPKAADVPPGATSPPF